MRLLVVSTWLPYPLDNGSRVRAYHLLKRLSQRHTITLLSFGSVRDPDVLAPLKTLCERLEVVPPDTAERQPARKTGAVLNGPAVLRPDGQRRDATAGRRTALKTHDAAIGMQVDAARYLGAHPEIPRVFEEAEVGVLRDRFVREADLLRRLRHGMTWWKFRRFVRGLVNRFDRTTVVSAVERDHLRAVGCDASRVAIVPNGTMLPEAAAIRRRHDNRLIYPGAVTYFANLDAVRYFVRDVLPLVRGQRPDVSFLVTGRTEGADIGDLARVPGVTFAGCLPDIDEAISESAVCVVPLRMGGGTRLKVLQAMALGTAVVSTSKGIEGLDVEPGRHVLVADSPSAFAAQVLRLLGDDNLRNQLVEASAALVRDRYTWDRIGEVLEGVVNEAVEEHAARRSASSATAL